jgi:hypothetical protein
MNAAVGVPIRKFFKNAAKMSPPSVNQMVMMLEKKGLISRRPGTPRSIHVLVPESELPPWGSNRTGRSTLSGRPSATTAGGWAPAASSSTPANLYVLAIFLVGGPTGPKFSGKEISRVIEIRGDQNLDQLHQAIFEAYDGWEQHAYEFQFGRRPYDPSGPNYGVAAPAAKKAKGGDARKKTLDELDLEAHRTFGYWFDFGDDWYHQVQVERIDTGIPTASYPRVIRRIGKSPPQYTDRQS